MQYANVIVDHRAGYDALTYSIPPELLAHLSVGSVVFVPFGRTKLHAIVTGFRKNIDSGLSSKLKPIGQVIYPGPYIPAYIIDAAQDLHRRYGFSLGELLFPLVPPLFKRKQAESLPHQITRGSGYAIRQYLIPALHRPNLYSRMAKRYAASKQSVLIICPSYNMCHALALALQREGQSVVIFPETASEREKRDYYQAALANTQPTIFLGTRGALITPLHTIGTIAIEEPWLPGHKEDNSPRFWSAMTAQALCRARNIPLTLVNSLPWPETLLLDRVRTHTATSQPGDITLVPRRPINEVIAQFLATNQSGTIVVRESHHETNWCPRCRETMVLTAAQCLKCNHTLIHLPRLTKDRVQEALTTHDESDHFDVITADELIGYKKTEAMLLGGFDAFLAIPDFRAPAYLTTLLLAARSQAATVSLVTHMADAWVPIMQRTPDSFGQSELEQRKFHNLPPYGLPVKLIAKQRDILTKLLEADMPSTLYVGKIRQGKDHVTLSLLLKPGSRIPTDWHRKAGLKVDVLPHYVE